MPTKICPPDKIDRNGKHGCNRLIPVSATDCPFCGWHFQSSSEVYEISLTKVVEDDADKYSSLEKYVAEKKLADWKNIWILRDICIKNKDDQKKAFMEAIRILRTKHGENISPQYYKFFKEHHLKGKSAT
jgi:hypothetical protein